MDDPDSGSLPAAVEVSISPGSPLPSRIVGIGEGEIQRLEMDLDELSSSIVNLKQELEGLRMPLVGLSETEGHSITAKCWTKQVREICYDTRDYLYDFIHSGNEFKLLEARALDASERFVRYSIQAETLPISDSTTSVVNRLPAPHAELIDQVDMVDEVTKLIANEKKLKVVSIVGPEGAGKTTLAKSIYRNIGESETPYLRAFLRASPNPDILRLLTSMFIQIKHKRPSCRLSAHDLIDSISSYLQNKRYFIIIDDLWTASVWETISRAFPDGDCGSRIITTTQSKGVALACSGYQSKYVFKMEALSDAQSENVFFRTAFGSEGGCPSDLIEVSRGIIRKCGGLPLATINIASMLSSAPNIQELTGICNSLPYTLRTNPTPEWMKEVVNLIYSTLKPHLKTCLLYFSMYPEGYILTKTDLVKQWVVEGFLDGIEGKTTEEVAGGYFDELVRRGLIQPVNTNKSGKVVLSCTLHHTVHDFIVNKSMEENFIITVDYFQSGIPLTDKVRRLSVQFGDASSAHIPESIMASEVRSLAFFGFFRCFLSVSMDKYRHLRVLILHIWADEDKDSFDLTGIRELLRLRYLKIACNISVKLPDKIRGQQCLERLEVSTVTAIPWDFGELSELRILKIAVTKLTNKDIYSLQILPALSALSLHVKTTPSKLFVFRKGGFSVLKFFTFRCSAPRLVIKQNSMPKIEKINLCFKVHEARPDGKKPITIRHLPSIQEISAKIWGTVADAGSALEDAVINHARNPKVQIMESREDQEHGTIEEQDEIMEEDRDDFSGKDKHTEADTRDLLTYESPEKYFIRPEPISRETDRYISTIMENKSQPTRSVPVNITFRLLEEITNSFSVEQKVGCGEYGDVYKGVHNRVQIAVKKLYDMPGLDDVKFKKECNDLIMVHHQNIVALVGYCHEVRHKYVKHDGEIIFAPMTERALCFEYLEGGSLDKHISDASSGLDWSIRYNIIKGVCDGLNYLHTGSKHPIFHMDLKPGNILLDKNMTPKIGDWCLSRLLASTASFTSKIIIGAFGYMPPEYIDSGHISSKFDVFSLGVIIIQIMAGPQGYSENADDGAPGDFIERVHGSWGRRLQPMSWQTSQEVKTCIEIALRCVESDPAKRPTISEIVNELNRLDAQGTQYSASPRSFESGIDPLELRFPFKLHKEASCVLQLSNRTDDSVAFSTKANRERYYAQPEQGVLPPWSRGYIVVTMRAPKTAPASGTQYNDEFLVQRRRVRRVSSGDDVDEQLRKLPMGEVPVVEEARLPIVYVALTPPPSASR